LDFKPPKRAGGKNPGDGGKGQGKFTGSRGKKWRALGGEHPTSREKGAEPRNVSEREGGQLSCYVSYHQWFH